MNKMIFSSVDKVKIMEIGKSILLKDKDYQFQNISATYFEKDNDVEVFIPFSYLDLKVPLNNVFPKFIISEESFNGKPEQELFISLNKSSFFRSRFYIEENLNYIKANSGYNIVYPLVKYITLSYSPNYIGEKSGFIVFFTLKSINDLKYEYPNYKNRIASGLKGFKNRAMEIIWILLCLTAFLNHYHIICTKDNSIVINENYLQSLNKDIKQKRENLEVLIDFKKVFTNEPITKSESMTNHRSCEYEFGVRGHYRHNSNGTTSWVRPYMKNKGKEKKDRNYRIKLD